MLNDIQRLRDDAALLRLLTHYADLAGEERAIWRDRLMAMEGVAVMSKLYGELIASDWLEINVGSPTGKRPGEVENSYRITYAGLRALRQAQAGDPDQDEEISLALAETPVSKGPPRRKPKRTAIEAA